MECVFCLPSERGREGCGGGSGECCRVRKMQLNRRRLVTHKEARNQSSTRTQYSRLRGTGQGEGGVWYVDRWVENRVVCMRLSAFSGREA